VADLPPPPDRGSPKRSGRWGGAPWWVWVLVVITIPTIIVIAGQDQSSNDDNGTTQAKAPAKPPPATHSLATKRSLTSCLTRAGVPVDTSGPSARLTPIDSDYVGTVTFARGGSADLWVFTTFKQLHPIRRAREMADTSGGAYYWDANRNIVFAIPANANLSPGEPAGKKLDACLN
jgi:hypothetical protein